METIESPPEWRLHQAYVQVDNIDGYRYLDLSGVVLNRLRHLFVQYGVNPGGCVLGGPLREGDPQELTFSAEKVWLHYFEPPSLESVVDTAPEWVNGIAKDIDVSRYSRLGFRAEYFLPQDDIGRTAVALARKMSGDAFQGWIEPVKETADVDFQHTIRFPVGDMVAAARVGILKIVRPAGRVGDYESHGVQFDVDVYLRRGPGNSIKRGEIAKQLKIASEHIYRLLRDVAYGLTEEIDDE